VTSTGSAPPEPPRGRDAAAGDATLEALFEEHAPFVWRMLKRLGVRPADLEDVCQEVFLVVHRKLPGFQGQSSVRTWIYGISARMASEYRRRPHLRREELTDRPPDRSVPAPQESALERRRALALLDATLEDLDEPRRIVFVLHAIEQLPMSEVAAIAGCPLQTAYTRYHAAQKQVEATMRRAQARWSPP
jgi:RNA polymerase sigma-70 factor (ECF subfamily)